MVEHGLLDEVRRLDALGLREGKTASRAIGYAQFLAVLDGAMSEREATEKTVIATRQFARRQVTWFGADDRVDWFDPLGRVIALHGAWPASATPEVHQAGHRGTVGAQVSMPVFLDP